MFVRLASTIKENPYLNTYYSKFANSESVEHNHHKKLIPKTKIKPGHLELTGTMHQKTIS